MHKSHTGDAHARVCCAMVALDNVVFVEPDLEVQRPRCRRCYARLLICSWRAPVHAPFCLPGWPAGGLPTSRVLHVNAQAGDQRSRDRRPVAGAAWAVASAGVWPARVPRLPFRASVGGRPIGVDRRRRALGGLARGAQRGRGRRVHTAGPVSGGGLPPVNRPRPRRRPPAGTPPPPAQRARRAHCVDTRRPPAAFPRAVYYIRGAPQSLRPIPATPRRRAPAASPAPASPACRSRRSKSTPPLRHSGTGTGAERGGPPVRPPARPSFRRPSTTGATSPRTNSRTSTAHAREHQPPALHDARVRRRVHATASSTRAPLRRGPTRGRPHPRILCTPPSSPAHEVRATRRHPDRWPARRCCRLTAPARGLVPSVRRAGLAPPTNPPPPPPHARRRTLHGTGAAAWAGGRSRRDDPRRPSYTAPVRRARAPHRPPCN